MLASFGMNRMKGIRAISTKGEETENRRPFRRENRERKSRN